MDNWYPMVVAARPRLENLSGLGNLKGLVETAWIRTLGQFGKENMVIESPKMSWAAGHRSDQNLPSDGQTHKKRAGW